MCSREREKISIVYIFPQLELKGIDISATKE